MPVIIVEETDQPEAKVAEYWNQNAAVWADLVRQGQDTYREVFNNPAFLKFVGDLRGKNVLDAGCGEGYNTRLLARQGAKLTGIDISESMITLGQNHEALDPIGIRYLTASFADLSAFKNSTFDTVVSFMALMDGPLYEEAIAEFQRVLKPGGGLYFSIMHPCFLTMGFGWQRDAEGKEICLEVADYFRKEPWLEKWNFSKSPVADPAEKFQVPRFPRTLSEYLNPIMASGMELTKLEEPRPSPELAAEYPWLERWRRHAAIFMYIAARKPA